MAGRVSHEGLSFGVVAFAAAHLGGAVLGHWLTAEPGHFATFWPSSGLLLAVLSWVPPRRWWPFLVAAVAVNLGSDLLLQGKGPLVALGFATANLLEGVVGAVIARRWVGAPVRLIELRSTLRLFAAAALIGIPLGALVGAITVELAFDGSLLLTWQVWWGADALGVLVTAPLVLGLLDARGRPTPARLVEGAILIAGLVLVGTYAFTATPHTAPIVMLLFLTWAAIRLGPLGVAVAAAVLAVVTVRHTNLHQGLFATTADPLANVGAAQVFVAVCTFVSYAFAVVLEERRRTEAELETKVRRRTAELERVLEASPVAIAVVTGLELRFSRLNATYRAIAGPRHRPEIGRTYDEVFPEAAARGAAEALRDVIRTGTPWKVHDFTTPIGNRAETWWEGEHLPLENEHGVRDSVLIVTWDVTDRRLADRELRESEALFRALGEAVPNLLWMSDADGRPLYQNPAWRAYTGLTGEALAERGWETLHHPDDVEALRQHWGEAVARGEPVTIDTRMRRHDGEFRWFSGRTVPIKLDSGRVVKWVGTLTDIHAHKQLEQQLRASEEALRDADRRKDEFLGTLAHELRNPLAPFRNGLQIMKLAQGNTEVVERARATMERQLDQMVRLIDDLMDLTRIRRGKIILQKTRMPLATAVHDAVDASRPLIDQQGHALELVLPDAPVMVDGDGTRLTQVFANLLNNAAKYTPRGGRIRLIVEREAEDVVVAVEDTGVGIPAAMLPRVFDIFTQVDRSLEKAQGGLGIGLSIVKQLAEMHGGSVEAFSEGHGMGSRFVVRLPAVRAPVDRSAASVDAIAAPAVRRRILVVDDNEDGAITLATMLEVMGNETKIAHDGLDAVAVAEAFRPEVILMDIGMPRLNGYDACRRIRDAPWGRDIVIIAQTGWGQDEDKRRSMEAGFDIHVVKPVDPAQLDALLTGARG